tara:strand:- start:206 stop:394 length:189 start_codon:yes stop_codon:yes gene_type:complete
MKSIALIKKYVKGNFSYQFTDPIIALLEHYKCNNHKRSNIILPMNGHNNKIPNNILASFVKR